MSKQTGAGSRRRRTLIAVAVAIIVIAGLGVARVAASSLPRLHERTRVASVPLTGNDTVEPQSTTTVPHDYVAEELAHSYQQDRWSADQVRDLLINVDGTYRYTVQTAIEQYVEEGRVEVDASTIRFLAETPTSALTLGRGRSASWSIVPDVFGSPTLALMFPQHDGYGGEDGEDIYVMY